MRYISEYIFAWWFIGKDVWLIGIDLWICIRHMGLSCMFLYPPFLMTSTAALLFQITHIVLIHLCMVLICGYVLYIYINISLSTSQYPSTDGRELCSSSCQILFSFIEERKRRWGTQKTIGGSCDMKTLEKYRQFVSFWVALQNSSQSWKVPVAVLVWPCWRLHETRKPCICLPRVES